MRHYEENILSSGKAFFILSDIHNNGSCYAKEIAETYDMHRPTVSEILNSLRSRNIVKVDESQDKPGKHFEINYDGLVEAFVDIWSEEYHLDLDNRTLEDFVQARYEQKIEETEEALEKLDSYIDDRIQHDDPIKRNTLDQLKKDNEYREGFCRVQAKYYLISYIKNYFKYGLIEYNDYENITINKMLKEDFRRRLEETKESINHLPKPIDKLLTSIEKQDSDDLFDEFGIKALVDMLETAVDTFDISDVTITANPEILYLRKKNKGITGRYTPDKIPSKFLDRENRLAHPFNLCCKRCNSSFKIENQSGPEIQCECNCREESIGATIYVRYLFDLDAIDKIQ